MTAVRSYQSGDIAALVTTWNQILVHDPVNQERFAASILCDPNMEAEGFSVIPELVELQPLLMPQFGAELSQRKVPPSAMSGGLTRLAFIQFEEDRVWVLSAWKPPSLTFA